MISTDAHILNTGLDEAHTQLQTQLPPQIFDAFVEGRAGLDARGVPADALRAGDLMPDGALLNAHGAPVTLASARAGRRAVIAFYRGGWCPYCNVTLRTYQQYLLPRLAELGVELIAISPQKPDGSLSVVETDELTYTVLSDPGNQLARGLGILSFWTDGARTGALAAGVDIASLNGDGTDDVPMPTVVVVDAGGVIEWIDIHPDYTIRTEPEAILAALGGPARK